ncbi:MAG: carbohydrate porin [Sedimentisphaerales bacterium]|nr:carbohydrate porin [Sedimentisphaerales bacterium]
MMMAIRSILCVITLAGLAAVAAAPANADGEVSPSESSVTEAKAAEVSKASAGEAVAASGQPVAADEGGHAGDWRLDAKTTPPPRDYSGDFWNRDTLTGDWGGGRNQLAEDGVTIDFGLTQTFQGVTGGGKTHTWRYQGSDDLVINLDMGKMGLWPGGFFKIHAENRFGTSVNSFTGALSPVNTDSLFPVPERNITTLSEVVYMQFLSPKFGVIMGKIQSREPNEFAGDERTQFMNTSLVFNPAMGTTVPLDTLGAGVLAMPTDWLTVTAMVMDSEGTANVSGFDTAFHQGVSTLNLYEFKVKPFGKPGHQRIGWTWSDRSRAELDQELLAPERAQFNAARDRLLAARAALEARAARHPRLSQILRERLRERYGAQIRAKAKQYARLRAEEIIAGLPERVTHQSSDWSIFYNFDQYLYTVPGAKDRGIGVFGRFGLSSGEVNPVQDFYSIGLGGKGPWSKRPHDSFGVGYYYLGASSKMSPLLNRFIEDEQGVEAYYSFAIAPGVRLTSDIQVIDPSIHDVDTTVVAGVRLQIDF